MGKSISVFLNGRAAVRYRALAYILPGRGPVPGPGIHCTGQRPGTGPWHPLYRAAARYRALASIVPGRGPVPGPGIHYTGPRVDLLEVVILVF
jgi:hypothetical protein